jgi:hypothetical protein
MPAARRKRPQTAQPAIPQTGKSIAYDRETRDYAMYFHGELVGFARSYAEAEITLDQLVYEQGKRGPYPYDDASDAAAHAAALAEDDRPAFADDDRPLPEGATDLDDTFFCDICGRPCDDSRSGTAYDDGGEAYEAEYCAEHWFDGEPAEAA